MLVSQLRYKHSKTLKIIIYLALTIALSQAGVRGGGGKISGLLAIFDLPPVFPMCVYINFISRGNILNNIVNLPYGPQTITIATKHTINY